MTAIQEGEEAVKEAGGDSSPETGAGVHAHNSMGYEDFEEFAFNFEDYDLWEAIRNHLGYPDGDPICKYPTRDPAWRPGGASPKPCPLFAAWPPSLHLRQGTPEGSVLLGTYICTLCRSCLLSVHLSVCLWYLSSPSHAAVKCFLVSVLPESCWVQLQHAGCSQHVLSHLHPLAVDTSPQVALTEAMILHLCLWHKASSAWS